MNRNQIVILISAVGMAGFTALTVAAYQSPLAYGTSESAAQVGNGVGIVGLLTSIGGMIWSVVNGGSLSSLVKDGGTITNSIDLLRPILDGKANVTDSLIRVALLTLEIDRSVKGDAEGLKQVHSLSSRILLKSAEPKT